MVQEAAIPQYHPKDMQKAGVPLSVAHWYHCVFPKRGVQSALDRSRVRTVFLMVNSPKRQQLELRLR
jgi:hypothetical protein